MTVKVPSFPAPGDEGRLFRRSGRFKNRALAFVGMAVLAIVPFHAGARPSGIQVSISNGSHGAHILTGEFTVASSTAAAWEILTNYDQMPSFVSSIKSSRRIRREKENWIVEQVMTGQAGIFRKRIHLLLEVNESPPQMISFHDISKKSFRSYSGSWLISSEGGGIKVRYHLEATPAFFAPDFLTTGAFKRNVKLLLEEVGNEIAARNKEDSSKVNN